MERDEAVTLLVNRAAELRLDMKISDEGVLPAEILCVLAWEQAILRRYQVAYNAAPPDVRKRVDDARALCLTNAHDHIRYSNNKEEQDQYINRIVRSTTSPAYVVEIKCNQCREGRPVVSLMENMAGARPFWTYFLDQGGNL